MTHKELARELVKVAQLIEAYTPSHDINQLRQRRQDLVSQYQKVLKQIDASLTGLEKADNQEKLKLVADHLWGLYTELTEFSSKVHQLQEWTDVVNERVSEEAEGHY